MTNHMIKATLAIAVTGCSTEPPPVESQTAFDLLVEIAQQSPNLTVHTSADFDGTDAYVTYVINGQPADHPLSGTATADFTLVGDTFYLSAFDTQVDDFSFMVAPFPSVMTNVDVSNARVQLATVDANGMVVAPPPIIVASTGANEVDASVTPVLVGRADLAAGPYAGPYTRTEQPTEPIVTHFTISETEVQVDLDYEYAITVSSPIQANANLTIHYTATIPL